ncbi:hypothetical protein L2735_19795 [Shewanella olleyana]|uniref:hypothetical protein n=1 Tax=Shewanella olleyana TaxID=135626 RepID=UPI00200F8327|nr:hypothetical protein [Shewanella olleyana]MCL1069001.1 hypothetical protein [Shewanella olleyana]
MNIKKVLSILAIVIVVLNLSHIIYSDFVKPNPQEELKSSFQEYFTDGDERIEMVWFSSQGKTISIALEISGLGEKPKNIELVKQNSRAYVTDKVCSSPKLKNFIQNGNYISVDIRNKEENYSTVKNIMNITMSAKKCL